MSLTGPHSLELNDNEHRRWIFRVDADAGYRLRVSRDSQKVGLLREPDLHYILHEHNDDFSAAQALCSRIAIELVDGLPNELKTALFAGFSSWIHRNRACIEESQARHTAFS